MTKGKAAVLLVDDVEANLVALEAQLGDMDCDLVRASSGNEALRFLLKREFAVMLLDVQMPGMDGFEVAALARENPSTRDVPIIFVTAMHGTDENALRGYQTGAVDFLYKPVNPVVLRSKVRVFLELYANRKKLADEIEAHHRSLADLEAYNYSVSHDLRAPLRHLDGFSRMLLEDYGSALDDNGKKYLERISSAALRMSQLIEDLLRLSQIRRTAMRPTVVDLAEIATAIVAELRRDDPERDVTFVANVRSEVFGDAGLLRIALENLLRNAWKFTRKRAKSTIELGQRDERGTAAYFVKDDGIGFDPKTARNLFRPFQRLHSSTDFEGTGIGLAIVERVVRHHGGRVWAEAEPEKGATFLFTLGDVSAAPASAPQ
jgi:two-component system, sensor histidine kinase and response regulator